MGSYVNGIYLPALGEVGWDDEVNANFRRLDTGIDQVRYAHPNGNNANDGLTWGTAKKDVVSAYDALTSPGTIFVASLTYWDSLNTDRGLWLLGPGDPGYSSPPVGWRVRKTCSIIGVGDTHTGNAHYGTASLVLGGSGTDRNKPAIWIAGGGGTLHFENINNQYPAVGWRFGVKSNVSGVIDSSSISLKNCSVALNSVPGNGPCVELGYMYWLFLEHCTLHGNPTPYILTAATRSGAVATFTTSITHFLEVGDTVYVTGVTPSGYNGTWTVTAETNTTFTATLAADPGGSGSAFGIAEPVKSYRRAAMAHWSDVFSVGGIPSGLLHLENCNFNGGGFYYKPNGVTSWGQVVMRDITLEGDFSGPEPPALLIRERTYGDGTVAVSGKNILVQNVEVADAAQGSVAVEVEGAQSDPSLVTVINASAAGPVTQLSYLSTRQQTGIHNGEFIGKHVGSNRSFAPALARYVNLASHTLSGGSWTTGLKAPNGTTNASSLTNGGSASLYAAGGGPSVGDWMIAGVWRRQAIIAAVTDNDWPIMSIGGPGRFDNGTTGSFVVDGGTRWNDGGWEWVVEGHKCTTVGDQFAFTARSGTGNTIEYFAPLLIRVPVADALDDDEVRELIRYIQTYPSTAPAGAISALAGQKLLAPAGIGVGNSAAATTPGSVVKKMEVFSETGASLGFIPIYSTIT
jgi:hypothetical protein